jgi:uncharacterized membrane protein
MDCVDAAHTHHIRTFQTTLARYVVCVLAADLSNDEY